MKGAKIMDNETLKVYLMLLSQGDKEAFVKIYEEIKKPVYTVIFRIVSSKEYAEDITQEFFYKLYKEPPVMNIDNPRAYFFKTARNMAIDHLRSIRETEALDQDILFEKDLALNIDIESALLILCREEREILTLHLNCGLSFAEISNITALSLPSVYRRYKKAIKKMKKQLQGG